MFSTLVGGPYWSPVSPKAQYPESGLAGSPTTLMIARPSDCVAHRSTGRPTRTSKLASDVMPAGVVAHQTTCVAPTSMNILGGGSHVTNEVPQPAPETVASA